MYLNNIKTIVAIVILLLSSLRGMFFLIFNKMPSQDSFYMITIVNIFLVIIFSEFFKKKHFKIKFNIFYNLFSINFFLGIIWLAFEFLYAGFSIEPFKIFTFYYILPLSILIFINVKKDIIIYTHFFISFILSISCILDFFITNIYPGIPLGIVLKESLLKYVISEENIVISRIGTFYRAHGLTGHYHDSGNVLTILLVFLYSLFVGNNNYSKLIVSILISISFLGLISTLSTANIVAAFVGIIIISFYSKRNFSLNLIFSLVLFISVYYYISNDLKLFDILISTFDSSGDKFQAMLNLGDSSLLENIITMIIGHESLTGISNLGYLTEAAFLSILMELGLINYIFLFMLLLLPLYYYYNAPKSTKSEMILLLITLLISILTLWHYGSLFRSTSIFLFFSIYALVMKPYLKMNN